MNNNNNYHEIKLNNRINLYLSYNYIYSNLLSSLPTQPQISPREEARHRVTGQVVDPPLNLKLPHDGVNPRESRPTL